MVYQDMLERIRDGSHWKVLVADDDEKVREITEIVLSNVRCLGRPLELLTARSGEETVASLRAHPDVVLILLDVVMETDDAGPVAARRIRNELGNHLTRIAVRTGQPGIGNTTDLSQDLAINSYHEKTDLTARKLRILVNTGIRSYCELLMREAAIAGLLTDLGREPDACLYDLAGFLESTLGLSLPADGTRG